MKALVGGTLIDGDDGRPIRNSVVLVEGEKIPMKFHSGSTWRGLDAWVNLVGVIKHGTRYKS